MTTTMTTRFARWLNLVPYFLAHQGVTYERAAADLGVTKKQLRKDLEGLWMCGLPGDLPGDLIEIEFNSTGIEVGFTAGIHRPLKLTASEASSLLIALRVLTELPGKVDPAATLRAIDKIEAAVNAAAAPAIDSIGGAAHAQDSDVAAVVRSALREGKALGLRYYSASRDKLGDRTVDPIEVVVHDGHSYLRGWCRTSEGVRLFRFDRIEAVDELDEPAAVPADVGEDASLSLFDPAADSSLTKATIEIAPAIEWVLEYHPCEVISTDPIVATMPYASEDWMARFVLGFGGELIVREPAALAAEVARRATEGLANYESDDGPGPSRSGTVSDSHSI